MTREEMLKALDDLYSKTGMDWHLKVSHSLTEPTCPTAVVVPEYFDTLGAFAHHADTIDAAIDGALARAVAWAQGGDVPPSSFPFTINFMDAEILALCLKTGEQVRKQREERAARSKHEGGQR